MVHGLTNRLILFAVIAIITTIGSPKAYAAPRGERVTLANAAEFLKAKKKLGTEKLTCRLPKGRNKKPVLGIIRGTGRNKFFFPLSVEERTAAKASKVLSVCPAIIRKQCRVVASDTSIAVGASDSVPVLGFGITSCNRPLSLVPEMLPQYGTLTGGQAPVFQLSQLFTGSDSATFKVTNGLTTSSNTGTLTVTVGEFAGTMTLAPYREKLTEPEVRRLLRKVAFGGSEELVQIGIQQGRSALVEALLSTETPASAMTRAVAAGQSLSTYPAPSADACGNSNVWWTNATQRYWHSLMLKGNPLLEHMTVHLHDHFAIDTQKIELTSGCASLPFSRFHLETLRDYSLGSFSGLLSEMLTDQAMSRWLDNTSNHFFGIGNPNNYNQNFAREFLELFTMGKYDHYRPAEPTYSEGDVHELTRAFTGQCLSAYREHSYSRDPATMRYYRDDQGPYGSVAVTACSDRRDPTAKMFLGSSSDDFTIESAADHVIRHPKTAENIAHSFFSRFVAVSPPKDTIVDPLAAQLASNNHEFNMGQFMRTVMNSSAMFSPEAGRACIDSPAEHLTFVSRVMRMPAESNGFLGAFASALAYSGHQLLQAPSVFSWRMCGDDGDGRPGNRGQVWLQQGWLIQRFNSINNLISAAYQYDGYDPRSMFSNPGALTPGEAISFFERVFNVTLSAPERTRVLQYLDRTTSRWDASNAALVRARLGGLYYIFATHVKVMTK